MVNIMKNIFKYFATAVAVVLAASCQGALDKPEVEAGFAAKGSVPSVSLDLENYKIFEADGYAEVTVTYTGVSTELDSLELGVLVSLTDNFLTSSFVPVEQTEDGTYVVQVPVRVAKKNYIKATAATISGSAYSQILELDVPDVVWYKKMSKTYTGDAYSYWDEGSCSYPGHTISVAAVENADGTATVTFTDFDPFAVANGFASVVTADFDVNTRVANITLDENGTFDAGLSVLGPFACVPFDNPSDLNSVDYMTVAFSEDYSQMTVQTFGTVSGEDWYEVVVATTYLVN